MAKFAQIINNKVVNIVNEDPTGKYHESLIWIPCTEETSIGDTYNVIDGVFAKPITSIDAEKRSLLQRLNQVYQSRMNILCIDFPEEERVTWSIQIEEAREWMKDNNAECLFLRNQAEARKVSIQQLVPKVLMANAYFRKYAGILTGRRQLLEDFIKGVNDSQQLTEAIRKIELWEQEEWK